MKRWLTHLLIVTYLGALSVGVACHALDVGVGSHPGMYMIVWDMFCGWSSYAGRIEVIGEGESGKYYQLAPGPWGDFNPYGDLGRRHYDTQGDFGPRMAINVLKHTQHEPITRIFVVQEAWPKKYNLPDHIWEQLYDEPKDFRPYYHVRHVVTPGGVILKSDVNWLEKLYARSFAKNPRLEADFQRSRPFFSVSSPSQRHGTHNSAVPSDVAFQLRAGSRLGN